MFLNMNTAKDELTQVLEAMKESEVEFYLTGSHFFGSHKEDSDWDFFTSDCRAIKFLELHGFDKDNDASYMDEDSEVKWVYRHKCGIDVQIAYDASLKNEAQNFLRDIIPGQFVRECLSKDIRKYYWRLAYAHAKIMRDMLVPA